MNQTQANPPGRIPVILLTGFLGAGKTTLLNRLLDDLGRERAALLINEFGETGIDGALLKQADDTLIEISDGCLCCTVRGEVADAMMQLAEHGREVLVIETTGLADPLPLIQTIIAHGDVRARYRLSSVITVVDGLRGELTLANHEEARNQIGASDIIHISKTDLQDDANALIRLNKTITALNPSAQILSHADLHHLADILLRSTPVAIENADGHDHSKQHHISRFKTVTLTHDQPVPAEQLSMFLDLVSSAYGDRVLRIKGIVSLTENPRPALVQLAANRYEIAPLEDWQLENADVTQGETRLVVISQNMQSGLIEKLFAGFFGKAEIDTPDREALSNNPLAISGNWKPDN